jgi:hypothetical protein
MKQRDVSMSLPTNENKGRNFLPVMILIPQALGHEKEVNGALVVLTLMNTVLNMLL